MDRKTAQRIMRAIEAMNKKVNAVAHEIEGVKDLAERKKLRLHIAKIMGETFTEVMIPIIKQFPDLDPDKGQ